MDAAAPDTSAIQEAAVTAGPVTGADRIVSLDILRGVAILGILVMNIYAFAMPSGAYSNPLAMGGTEPHNLGTWFFTHFFFDQKFLSIFAMLFGAGIVMMSGRAEKRGAKPARIYYRRQILLVLIGAAHAYLLWVGDILFVYAAIGMLAYLFRKRAPRTLAIIAVFLIGVTMAMSYGLGHVIEAFGEHAEELEGLVAAGEELDEQQQATLERWDAISSMIASDEETLKDNVETHRGSYTDIVAHRVPLVIGTQQWFLLFFGWRYLGLMMIGMTLMKLGVVTGERTTDFYRKLMLIGYGLGLPLTVYSGLDLYAHQFDEIYMLGSGGISNAVGSIVVALGHIGLVMLVVKTAYLPRLMARFGAVGRMALSNYLMHSVILTTVFYGYGLGLYGQVPRFWQMGFVAAVIALQLFLSPWWLSRYRFGPVEWLWRSMTYWKRQPMRQVQV